MVINTEYKAVNSIYLGTDTNVSGRGIVGNTSNLDELATGYNSGDEYTGRTENNLTLAEWQEVSIKSYIFHTNTIRFLTPISNQKLKLRLRLNLISQNKVH